MKQLQIITCVKQVPDPEGPAVSFKIDPEAKKVNAVGIPPVISPFDENALEAALRIKDTYDAKITVLSMGEKLAKPVLKRSLAVGADELILLKDDSFKDLDSYSSAYVLSCAIRKMAPYDVILTGRQSGDWDFGIVGLLIAEMLKIPCISLARKVEVQENVVIVESIRESVCEIARAPMPVLVTVTSEIGDLRYPSLKRVQVVRNASPTIYNSEDLGLDLKDLRSRRVLNLIAPQYERRCEFIEGEYAQERGERLAIRLKKDSVI